MKKALVIFLACLMVVSLLAGCGGSQKSDTKAPAAKPTQMILATGGTAGTYYPLGGAMAQIFNKNANVNVTAQATGASIENLRLVNKKDAELAMVQSDMMDYAFNGKEAFKEKLTNISGIAILYPEVIQVVVRSDSGIKTIADLKDKKVGVGAPGSGTEANFRQLLDAYDMDIKSVKAQFLSFSESSDQFKDKHIDAFIVTAGIPNSAIMDIATQHSISIINIPDDVLAKLTKKYTFLAPVTIPTNTYKGQAQPVKTVAVMASLIVNSQVSETDVYNITKALFDKQPDLASAHAKGKELSLQTATKGMSIPLHPGAAKYYKEKGIVK
jgi:TRAP transporter TAXI family solute receptor